ncbi:MAG: hypothetical protein K0B85_09710, partial [Coriobacteriia bacterium]|nr:hypothetical protein [Coriobacteriia bacterium]
QNLFRMMKFAELYPDVEIFSTVSRKLGWSHIAELLLLNDPDEPEFYAAHAAGERCSVRTLRERIASQLYLRTIAGEDPGDQIIAADAESQAPDNIGRTSFSEIRTCSTSSACPANTRSPSSRQQSSTRFSDSCSNSEWASPSSSARSA